MAETAATTIPGTQDTSKGKRPTKGLPTVRMSLDKQLEILRAYAAASGDDGKAVSKVEAAKLAKVHESTPSLLSNFFVDAGLLSREGKKYRPAPEVFSYQKMWQWKKETAAHKLAPVLSRSWFWAVLKPMLTMGSVERTDAIPVLSEAAGATTKDKAELLLLMEWLQAAGLVSSDESRYNVVEAGEVSERTGPPPVPAPPPSLEHKPRRENAGGSGADREPWMELLLRKFPDFDPSWSDELKKGWFEAFEKLMAKGGQAP
ncbi:MAG TPA: hypothetical protein VGM13_13280 [Thermoanaerobaculia bacterium]|jgi:hypothetical protein